MSTEPKKPDPGPTDEGLPELSKRMDDLEEIVAGALFRIDEALKDLGIKVGDIEAKTADDVKRADEERQRIGSDLVRQKRMLQRAKNRP